MPQTAKERVRFEGVLRAAGKDTACIGWCTEVTPIKDRPADPVYTDYRIYDNDVSQRLPDGTYELLVHGISMRVTRRNGRWLIG